MRALKIAVLLAMLLAGCEYVVPCRDRVRLIKTPEGSAFVDSNSMVTCHLQADMDVKPAGSGYLVTCICRGVQ